jgi:PAS domain S-box-containing protein
MSTDRQTTPGHEAAIAPEKYPAPDRESYFRALVENSSDAICLLDTAGFITYMTPACRNILGYAPEEMVGTFGCDFVHPDDKDETLQRFAQGVADPAALMATVQRVRHKAGHWKYIEAVMSNRLAHPAVQALVVNFRDATERETSAVALRESEERYRILFQRNLAGVFRSRMDGTLLDCNDSFARIFGLPGREEMLRHNTHEFDRSPEDRRRFADALTAQGQLTNYESPARRADGSPIWLLENIMLRTEDGSLVQEGTVIDITDRKRAEDRIRRASALEAFGQLAGGVAHDFNNLLTALLGNLSLALDRLPEGDPNRDLLAEAERAGWRAAELTGQLLGFARCKTLQIEPVHLPRGVTEMVGILKRTLDPRIAVQIQLAADLWPVLADAGRLNQMIMNLCLNARDAMPEGGRLTLEGANVTVDAAAAARSVDGQAGDYVRLSVIDTGHGMSEQVRRHIFEPFFTTKPAGKGTGLGLAMVLGLVRQHNGWIECESGPGRGARFDVYLPRSPRPAAAEPADAGRPLGGDEVILLVDDDEMIRHLGRTLLTQSGYQVLLADDGATAVDLFRQYQDRIDLVILDLTMPRLPGRETFLELKQINPAVRVLFSSAYSAEDLPPEISATAAGFVNKPYRVGDLIRAVRAALDGSDNNNP